MRAERGGMVAGVLQSWRDQPRALFGLCVTEMWERFGFVTMTALKLLFLVSPVAAYGLGWAKSDAFMVLAWVSIAIYMAPLAGGWLSDTLLGPRRSILLGGALMACGYLGLGLVPYALTIGSELPLRAIVASEGLALGQFVPDPAALARVATRIAALTGADPARELASFRTLYRLQSILLVGAISLVVVGNALFKPSVSSLVGSLYTAGDARRDGGFTLFWTCINVGSFLAMIIGGGVGERFGWHLGFFCAAVGMLGGLVVFLRVNRTLPTWVKPRRARLEAPEASLDAADRRRLAAILLMIVFAVIFNANHGQIYGLVSLFILQDVDRSVGSFELPALWITSLNPLLILLTAPATAALWDILGKRGRNPSFASKFALALALLTLGQGLLTSAAFAAQGPAQASIMWVGLGIILLSLAEIPLQPIGLAMVTRLTPARLVSTMIGVWLLNYAFAAWLGNMVASRSEHLGLPAIFALGTLSCAVATALLLVLKRPLDRWMVPAEAEPLPAELRQATA